MGSKPLSILPYLLLPLSLFLLVYSAYWGFLLVAGASSLRRSKAVLPLPGDLPTVSVIVATKNEETVVGRLIASLRALNYDPSKLEFVIAESGSTDGTRAAVARLAGTDPRIRLVTPDGEGKGNALNAALRVATGELFFFLDADCVPEKDFLLKTVSQYVQGKDVVVGYSRTINSAQSLITRLAVFEDILWRVMSAGKARLGLSVPLAGPCSVVSRRAMLSVDFQFRNVLTEDIELWMRLLKSGHVAVFADTFVWMEAPSGLKALLRQRMRWYRGYLETALRHADVAHYTSPRRAADAMLMLSTPFFAMLSLFSYFISSMSLPQAVSDAGIFAFIALFLGANVMGFFALNIGLAYILGEDATSMIRFSPLIYMYTTLLSVSSFLAILNMLVGWPKGWSKTERSGYVDAEVPLVRG